MINRYCIALLTFALLLLTACSSNPDIIVTDAQGNPVVGATITGTSLSTGGQTSTTDNAGHAPIPSTIQATKWIRVSKTGYHTQTDIPVDNKKRPIQVMLKLKNDK